MQVSIVGAGYVGLVTGACLADWGHDVVLCDIDAERVDVIRRGTSPIHEIGLTDLLERNVGGRLRATTSVEQAVSESEVTLLAVGTPTSSAGIDLSGVTSACRMVGESLARKDGWHTVIVKSTVVPGTTDGIVTSTLETASGRRAGEGLGIGMNPEFLTEGCAVADFLSPDRLVLGANDARTHGVLSELYASVATSVPRLLTNTRTAEMIKYASNALLATMISFSNEIADLCVATGDVDVVDVMAGVHASEYLSPLSQRDGRIKAPITSFLDAGCGFGGSCLPKDLRALVGEGVRRGVAVPVLRGALETNDARPHELIRVLEEICELRGLRVTLLGVAFKPDTDDARESPAIPIAEGLAAKGAVVTLHDPVVRVVPALLEALGIGLEPDLATALADADALVLVTSWDAYRDLPELVARAGLSPIVLDGRRMFDPSSFRRYAGIGRG